MGYGSWNKYGAKKTTVDGITFDSRHEAERWCELVIMERAGVIEGLQRQVRFEIVGKTDKFRARYYVADFVYREDGKLVVEDAKGCRSGAAYQIFRLKQAIMYEKYGIEIKEV